MPSYAVLAGSSTLQVPASNISVDAVSTTIQASGGVTATLVLPASWFDTDAGNERLLVFADALNTINANPKVVSGAGGQSTDANGLLQDVVDWVVGYPEGSKDNALLTRTVEIACSNIGGTGLGTGQVGPAYALEQIQIAYGILQQIAQGG